MDNVFSRILVGIDDSETSQDAVALAARLAHEHGTQLILCHSVNWLPVVSQSAAAGGGFGADELIDEMKQEGEVLLARAEEAAKHEGVDPQRRALEGEPAKNILALARAEACSLIVMGTRGRKGVERLFLGSTAEAVLRGSTIPVLTVCSAVKGAAEVGRCFERILVGVDDSEPSDAAIKAVFELPAEDRQRVLFYSISRGPGIFAGCADTYVENHEFHGEAQDVVDRALAWARARGIAAEGNVVDGSPADTLIEAALNENVDLIVV